MIHLTIDGRAVTAAPGTAVLAAAEAAGAAIPTLCQLPGEMPYTSCMVCVVAEARSGRLIPSCSAPVEEGMEIETGTEAVRDARRAALELLLGEHVGDCDGPCERSCPAAMDIPRMIRLIAAGNDREALATVKEAIPLPAVLGRVCPAPCEKACRRGEVDAPVRICLLKRYVADRDLARKRPYLPTVAAASGKRVAVVGSGPAGLSAAWFLLLAGHGCEVFDIREQTGGMLRYGVPEADLDRSVLDAEVAQIVRLGARIRQGERVGRELFGELRETFDAVVLATGQLTASAMDRFGLGKGPHGVRVNGRTGETTVRGVFAAGAVVRPMRAAIRAVGAARKVAAAVDQYVRGARVTGPARPFHSTLGRLLPEELSVFLPECELEPMVSPLGGLPAGFNELEARREALRCMRCDCRKKAHCGLRTLAAAYGAAARKYAGRRRWVTEKVQEHPEVVFEPTKCIKCGRCVRITQRAGEPVGLTFLNRGFLVRVGAPLGVPLAEALTVSAAECVAWCPTGALAFRADQSERVGERLRADVMWRAKGRFAVEEDALPDGETVAPDGEARR